LKAMKLSKLLAVIPHDADERAVEFEITSLAYDSRKAVSGSLFFCLKGEVTDGHLYAQSAYGNGCRAFLVTREVALPHDAIIVRTDDTRRALALLSAEFFGHPEKKLRLIGVTGTKGKTTVSTLLAEARNRAGYKTGLIGTNGILFEGKKTPTANSTPESYELQKAFADMVEGGAEYAVMEVSSQAYLTGRVYGLSFHLGIYTNLSADHIGPGEHKDFENYMQCKSMLFAHSRYALINVDDAYSEAMALAAAGDVLYYSLENEADYAASDLALQTVNGSPGMAFSASLQKRGQHAFRVRTPGRYSVYNALAVAAACDILGLTAESAEQTLENTNVDGRFEIVPALPMRTFVIDYAHNELSLQNILETLRLYEPKRLVCLFGSVGGRTELRRKAMGEIAASLCDFCILTSDNPGSEPPTDIIADIEKGFLGHDCPYTVIPDREEAIRHAVLHSQEGDVILFAGKGHETYQLIDGVKVPFCEREIIEQSAKWMPTV